MTTRQRIMQDSDSDAPSSRHPSRRLMPPISESQPSVTHVRVATLAQPSHRRFTRWLTRTSDSDGPLMYAMGVWPSDPAGPKTSRPSRYPRPAQPPANPIGRPEDKPGGGRGPTARTPATRPAAAVSRISMISGADTRILVRRGDADIGDAATGARGYASD